MKGIVRESWIGRRVGNRVLWKKPRSKLRKRFSQRPSTTAAKQSSECETTKREKESRRTKNYKRKRRNVNLIQIGVKRIGKKIALVTGEILQTRREKYKLEVIRNTLVEIN